MTALTTSPTWWRGAVTALLIGALALCVGTGVQARQRVLKQEARDAARGVPEEKRTNINDFHRWTRMTPHFLAPGDPRGEYVDDALPNPPIILTVFGPLTRLSRADAQIVWASVKWLFLITIVWCLFDTARRAGVAVAPAAGGLFLLAWFFPVMGDLQEGQTNLLMLTPLAAGLWLAQRGRRGTDVASGALIALAACIKITPLIFVVYMLWRRRWWVALGALAGIGLWLFVVPGVIFGWERNLRWLHDYVNVMILPYAVRGEVQYAAGQSIPSVLTRLLTHTPAFATADGFGTPYMNVLDLPPGVVKWVIRAVLGAIGLAGLWWMRKRLPDLKGPRYLLEAGAVGVFMLWASERTWVPHFVSAGVAMAAAAMIASDPRETPKARAFATWALGAAFVLMGLTSDVSKVLGRFGPEWMKSAGVCVLACAGLMGAVFKSRWAGNARDAEAPAQPPAGVRA